MFDLQTIIKINNKPAVKAETNFERECSWQGDPIHGVVVHSAKFRNTVFLVGGKAKRFIAAWWSTNNQDRRNHIAEALFN